MTTALVATVAGVLLAAGGLAVLAAMSVLPLLVALDRAQQRGLGTARWGAASLGCSAVGVGVGLLGLRSGSLAGAVVGALVAWAGPAAAALVPAGRLAGTRGRHE